MFLYGEMSFQLFHLAEFRLDLSDQAVKMEQKLGFFVVC